MIKDIIMLPFPSEILKLTAVPFQSMLLFIPFELDKGAANIKSFYSITNDS